MNRRWMIRRLFWPLLGTFLLEGYLLGIVWWAVAAAAIATVGYVMSEARNAHRGLVELMARFNADNPPPPPRVTVRIQRREYTGVKTLMSGRTAPG